MREQHALNLRRVNIKPAHNDHVFLALNDVRVAILVHARNVTRVQPALAGGVRTQSDCGFVWAIPITFHHLRPGYAKFAFLPDWDLGHTGREIDYLDIGIRKRKPNAPRFASTERGR